MNDEYTVGVAAELSGVSVRTLHYYDEIGLAQPSSRSAAGYRLYTDADLAMLQRIVFYRELGLDLGEIADVLANPNTSDAEHLRRQRELIEQRIARHQAMLAVIDKELAARAAGIALTARQRREVFGGDLFIDEHVDEQQKETYATGQEEIVERRLRDGRAFPVIKNFVDPDGMERRLRRLGWDCVIRRDGGDWVCGEARLHR